MGDEGKLRIECVDSIGPFHVRGRITRRSPAETEQWEAKGLHPKPNAPSNGS